MLESFPQTPTLPYEATMADLNTGTNIIVSEAETKRKDGAEHAIPGAFPTTPGTSSETRKDPIGDSQVAATIQPVPPPQTDVGDSQSPAVNIAISTHPMPPRQTEVGTGNAASSTSPQHRSHQHDENPASRSQEPHGPSADNERNPVNEKDESSNNTVKPAELAQEVGESASTAAVAGGLAAKDAAVWTKDKAAEHYPAVRDQAVDAASKAGNAAYAGAASAAATIAGAAQAAYNATASGLTTDTQTDTLPPASSVAEPVKDSFATAKKSPEAAANPVAVGNKRALESELLATAGDKDAETTSNRADESSIAPSHDKKPSPLEGKRPLGGHMPNRTESTDFVKVLGTETYKPHGSPGSTGPGAAAQEASPAHGGGPAAPHDAGRVTGGAVLKQGGMSQDEPETSYTHDKSTSPRNEMHPQGMGTGGQSSGIVAGTPRSLQSSSVGDHVAPPTGTAAQAPGHGPAEHNPPSYSQAQRQGQAPAKTTVGNNAVKDVDYNKLSSGTPSGVASTHSQSK